ncbi:hypothetical protein BC938DRAFT_481111 [Jimgerdemannia flammicorona]|uniref:Uncharacterized protein n=1 Tax=Jimgerdemannia flammicorona TaxID=994334 RepID=A0A433QHN6_9FUNG|nr:hypothetical protein BC938DRAFT_481111 [Jimgerdemannia flammicorona]
MLVELSQLVHLEEKKIRQLQVVGLLHGGLKLQILRINCPGGYVSILKPEAPKIKDVIKLLASVWQVKKMIMDCALIVNTLSSQTAEEFLEEVINNGLKASSSTITLPWSQDTPIKLPRQRTK